MSGACPFGEGWNRVRTRGEEEGSDRPVAGPAKTLAYASSTENPPACHSIFSSSSRERKSRPCLHHSQALETDTTHALAGTHLTGQRGLLPLAVGSELNSVLNAECEP